MQVNFPLTAEGGERMYKPGRLGAIVRRKYHNYWDSQNNDNRGLQQSHNHYRKYLPVKIQ